MPRSKRPARRLSEDDRARMDWNMEEQGRPQEEQEVVVLDDNEQDSDWEEDRKSWAPAKRRKTKKSEVPSAADKRKAAQQRQERIRRKKMDLEPLADAAKFYFSVGFKNKEEEEEEGEGGGGFVGTLGKFDFSLAPGESWPDPDFVQGEDEFWIYPSSVPEMSFALFQSFVRDPSSESERDFLERRRRGVDPDDFQIRKLRDLPEETMSMLECFAPGVGVRRRCCNLVLDSDRPLVGEEDDGSSPFRVRAVATDSTLMKLRHPADVPNPVPACVKRTLNGFFGLGGRAEEEEDDGGKVAPDVRPDIDELYEVVKRFHESASAATELDPINPQHHSLLPTLRPYQKLAVRWMLSKEKAKDREEAEHRTHVLYTEVKTLEGHTLHYNAKGGYLVKDRPLEVASTPGGILADEMGLGKTVEVLSLMLCHHREDGLVKPEWKEPVILEEKPKKKLRRNRREPSPVEFVLNSPEKEPAKKEEEGEELESLGEGEEEILEDTRNSDSSSDESDEEQRREACSGEENIQKLDEARSSEGNESSGGQERDQGEAEDGVEDVMMQVDGCDDVLQADGNADDDGSEDTSDEEYVPRPTRSRRREMPGHTSSTSEEESAEEEEYVPIPSTSRGQTSRSRIVESGESRGQTSRSKMAESAGPSKSGARRTGKSKSAPKKRQSPKSKKSAIRQRVDTGEEEEEEEEEEEYVPRPSTSRSSQAPKKTVRFEDDNDEGEVGQPPPKRSNPTKKSVRFKDEDEEEEEDVGYVPRPSTSRSAPAPEPEEIVEVKDYVKNLSRRRGDKKVGILKKAKMIDTTPAFDPASILGGRAVTAKSTMSDMVLHAVATITKDPTKKSKDGASLFAIKKFVSSNFGKGSAQHVKQCNKSLAKLTETGLLVNTTHGTAGANGSFIVNPDYANFDSRGINAGKELDAMEEVIEDVITRHCYEGKPYDREEVEAKLSKHKKAKKEPSTFQKLKSMYDRHLAEESLAFTLTPAYERARKKWFGSFFDTKVDQASYFECICGSELDAEYDDKHRIQCVGCQLWQHSECVKYHVADPYRGDYYCPHCWTQQPPVPSGATLIVSPSSISYQWIEEIQKHIRHRNVRMLFYEGTKQAGYIQPRDLARYDIVITTYAVLQSETNYVDLPHSNSAEGRRFRNPKRFMAIPAPLPCVEWWRVCLDEAQMIECTTTKTAEMALRLSAVNRWCVTGTPIEKSLNDLQGLLLFLKVDPYSLGYWWSRCLYAPYCRGDKRALEELLCKILWRTAKKDVLDQINIPLQTEEVHWLSFSPIEEHFYRRQHIECSREAAAKIRRMPNLDARLSSIDRNTLSGLLNPMLKLRQSCCHPQAVRGQFLNMQSKSTTTAMTMEELLEQMVKKVVLECEEFHRQFVAALNGLAGIAIIEQKWAEAADKYREAIRVIEEHKENVKTDTLQRLHTLTNLAEVLEAGHEGIDPTLRDSSLRDECKELQTKYLSKYINATRAAREAVHPTTEAVEALQGEFTCHPSSWYVQIVDSVSSSSSEDCEDSLMEIAREELAQFYDVANDREFDQIKQRYPNARMVLYKVADKIEEFDKMRETVCTGMKELETSPPESFLNGAVDCHLRQIERGGGGNKCKLCLVHENIEVYENLIFKFVKADRSQLELKHRRSAIDLKDREELEEKGVFMVDTLSRGNWAESEGERLLRAMLKFARSVAARKLGLPKEVLDDGATHMKLLETMKKEFRQLRVLWRQIYDHVAAVDELNMSVMRLRLRFEDEPQTSQGAMKRKKKSGADVTSSWLKARDKIENVYILEEHELPAQRLKLVSERTISQAEFRKKHGQLQYLHHLRSSDYGRGGGGENPEPCPICRAPLGTQWTVLQCGHCYCVDCTGVLTKRFSSSGGGQRSLRCPVCRSSTFHSEISYVNTKKAEEVSSENHEQEGGVKQQQQQQQQQDATAPEIEVKGSLSTKMEAVVRTLLRIRRDNPSAKSLVFSSWPDVLDIVASALQDNDIQHAALHAQGKFKRNLQKFKNRDDVKVLLLPISSGANGLNLIEASHVLLIEPILNPAQELQAIGRVHRIGQTEPTVVHKFVVRATIEERMHRILSSYKATDESTQGSHSTEENVLTVRDLKNIFVDGDD